MRKDITFDSNGLKCSGWLTMPENTNDNIPIIVMAHGFGGTKDVLLEQYAIPFNKLGFATLIFDYRHWGESEGKPRNDHNYKKQIKDWQAALTYVKALPKINKSKIILWGTSFSGGLVLTVASKDKTIAATVSQCPMLDGQTSTFKFIENAGILQALKTGVIGIYDILKSLVGSKPYYVNSRAEPGNIAAMPVQDAWDSLPRFTKAATLPIDEYYNKVTARSLLRVGNYRPIKHVKNITCPSLFLIAGKDTVAPAETAEKALTKMKNGVAVKFPDTGHFDIYLDEDFENSLAAQVNFLKQFLQN